MAAELEKREKKEVTHTFPEQLVDADNAFAPDVDIYETEGQYIFLLDMPGVKKGDVRIDIDENNTLVVQAKATFTEPNGSALRQFRMGNFYRAFMLSNDMDKTKMSGQIVNGLLEVTVPKREEAKPRKIQIKA